jgi:hypothetical protein
VSAKGSKQKASRHRRTRKQYRIDRRKRLRIEALESRRLLAGGNGDGGGDSPWPVDLLNWDAEAGITVAPGSSPGILAVNDFDLQSGSTLNIETGGTIAGTDYDQVNVAGTVALAGTLDVDLFSSIVKGTPFTIVNNDGVDAIVGTFAGLSEGATIDNGYDEYSITYVGGDGNDVVLTALTDVRAVTNTNDAGAGSLRGELIAADAIADPVAVVFLIPGTGPHTIAPGSALPSVTGTTYIDATTQFGYAGSPRVEVEGSGAGFADGFSFVSGSDGSLLRGLAIGGFQDGVQVSETSDIVIAGNYIGVDTSGTTAVPNGFNGVDVSFSRDVLVGGPDPGDRNVISGNIGHGVRIHSGATGTIVEGNYIGTTSDGMNDLGNGGAGVVIQFFGGAPDVTRGNFVGQVGGQPNVISGNDSQGVLIREGVSGNQVVNNWIGLASDGSSLVPNSAEGVRVTSAAVGNTIGLAGAGNVIAGTPSPFAAIRLDTVGNVVRGN